MSGHMHTTILCPICEIPFDSHLSYTETGKRIDEHIKAKHPEHILYPDSVEFGDPNRPRGRGVYE